MDDVRECVQLRNVVTVNDLVLSHKGVLKESFIHHPSVYSIIHQDLQLKCLEKRRAKELTRANCVH